MRAKVSFPAVCNMSTKKGQEPLEKPHIEPIEIEAQSQRNRVTIHRRDIQGKGERGGTRTNKHKERVH